MGKIDKKNKKTKHRKFTNTKSEKNVNYWMSIALLIIMVLSIGGFALSGSFSVSNKNNSKNNIPLQQFQDKNSGKIFWGAVKNGKQFIFLNISGFNDNNKLYKISDKIKKMKSIYVYTDKEFNSAESMYIFNKALTSLNIKRYTLNQQICSNNSILIGYNITLSKTNNHKCIILNVKKGQEFRTFENLVYFLIQ